MSRVPDHLLLEIFLRLPLLRPCPPPRPGPGRRPPWRRFLSHPTSRSGAAVPTAGTSSMPWRLRPLDS
uniref:Uncharacterized protein n=1 Tax=Arundo donax TaxID=35708 RepID=A0A0A9B8H1_ARUDO